MFKQKWLKLQHYTFIKTNNYIEGGIEFSVSIP